MHALRFFDPRILGVVAFGAITSVAAAGFAASNTVPGSSAGDGQAAVSGYTISAVAYTLKPADPSKIDQIAFTIVPAVGTVKAKFDGSWYSCNNAAGVVTCNTTSPQASAGITATTLEVAAAE